MGDHQPPASQPLPPDLQAIATQIEAAALSRRGDELALLELLRLLEKLHSQVREGWFQEALPDNRRNLYALLRDIEVSGGWPYIQRMRLQALLQNLSSAENNQEGPETT